MCSTAWCRNWFKQAPTVFQYAEEGHFIHHKRCDYREHIGEARGTELIRFFIWIRTQYILSKSHLHATTEALKGRITGKLCCYHRKNWVSLSQDLWKKFTPLSRENDVLLFCDKSNLKSWKNKTYNSLPLEDNVCYVMTDHIRPFSVCMLLYIILSSVF